VHLGADIKGILHGELLLFNEQLRRLEAFMDGDIGIPGMLKPPFVWIGVATEGV